jgi:hypothetical protein
MPLRALEPKSRASANSATFAHRAAETARGGVERNTAGILCEGPSR